MLLENKNSDDPLANKSLNTLGEIVRSTYKYALKEKIYDGDNPAQDIIKFDVDNQRTRYLSVEEIQLLLSTLKIKNDNLYMCALLAVMVGARIDVITHIKIKDIDLVNNTIQLRDEKAKKAANKTYIGFINEKYHNIIKEHILKIDSNPRSEKYVLYNANEPMDRKRHYQRRLKEVLDNLFNKDLPSKSLDRVVVHTLRHTFGSQLANNGTDIYTIKELMNHSDIRMTMRYAKLDNDSKRLGANKLDF